jgi:hypothetical protein
MKLLLLLFSFFYAFSCPQKNSSNYNKEEEEHFVIDIDEKTDSIYKVFKPTIKNVNSSRIIIKGYWNDTVNMMHTLMAKNTVDHNGVDAYYSSNPPIYWTFKKYKATKYHIRYEVVFYQKYFESYKDNY